MKCVVSDFDDTLYFTEEAIKNAAKELYSLIKDNAEENVLSDLEKIIETGKVSKGFDKKYKHNLYLTAFDKYANYLKLNTTAVKFIRSIMDQEQAHLIILSARGEELRKQTEKALEGILPYYKIILPQDHSIKDEEWKTSMMNDICREYDYIYFLEDKEENINYIIQNIRGCRGEFYLVNHSEIKTVRVLD